MKEVEVHGLDDGRLPEGLADEDEPSIFDVTPWLWQIEDGQEQAEDEEEEGDEAAQSSSARAGRGPSGRGKRRVSFEDEEERQEEEEEEEDIFGAMTATGSPPDYSRSPSPSSLTGSPPGRPGRSRTPILSPLRPATLNARVSQG